MQVCEKLASALSRLLSSTVEYYPDVTPRLGNGCFISLEKKAMHITSQQDVVRKDQSQLNFAFVCRTSIQSSFEFKQRVKSKLQASF